MDIEEHLEILVFVSFTFGNLFLKVRADQLNFREANLEALRVIIGEEEPIHVLALRVASIVASDDAIWVHNRRNPKLEHVPHLVADDLTADQVIDKTVDDKRRMSLSAMLSTNYDNNGLLSCRIALILIGYFYQRNVKVAI